MRRVILIRPRRDGRIFGKAPGSPYTLMRLASLVPNEIPVEIWDENVRDLPLDTVIGEARYSADGMAVSNRVVVKATKGADGRYEWEPIKTYENVG